MGCSSCGISGHFGAYVPATERSYITTTGRVESVPNATGGMHTSRLSRPGMSGFMDENFGPTQVRWISGVDNEIVALGAAAVLLMFVMK